MPFIIGSSTVVPGTAYTLAPGDSIYVPRLNTVVSTAGSAIVGSGSDRTAIVAGDVFAASFGIALGTSGIDTGNIVHVLAGATVAAGFGSGSVAVRVQGGGSTIVNEGSLSGGFGVVMGGDGTGSSMLTNTGTISGDYRVVGRLFNTSEKVIVTNYGSIVGTSEAAVSYNSGTAGLNAVDVIVNRGLMSGDVKFGDGADIYDGRGGRMIGTVFGEEGADLFLGNVAESEIFNGGADVDTLDFRVQGAVGLALDGAFGSTGSAQGDTYIGIENVFGSDGGNDVIRGDAANNALFGFGGNDNLNGQGGADVLRGGVGGDSLVGGLGNDLFRYDALGEAGDVITDFSATAGNDDLFLISAAGFGGGLAAGALAAAAFQSRADNIAQDADDRVIFRTTDQTVWFDADGNGIGAAVLLADLQTGAVVTAADFLIF